MNKEQRLEKISALVGEIQDLVTDVNDICYLLQEILPEGDIATDLNDQIVLYTNLDRLPEN
jgi:hypothetical protein|tara:strand:- start:697 stop:879 length:183 start_codon:yes stop_codon:yes gene_type:complete